MRHWGVLAKSAGALFIRSYERGERVHLAMVSRGYAGIDAGDRRGDRVPGAVGVRRSPSPCAALVVCLLGWTL